MSLGIYTVDTLRMPDITGHLYGRYLSYVRYHWTFIQQAPSGCLMQLGIYTEGTLLMSDSTGYL
jgi:hypothetical protein